MICDEKFCVEWDPRNRSMWFKFYPLHFYLHLLSWANFHHKIFTIKVFGI